MLAQQIIDKVSVSNDYIRVPYALISRKYITSIEVVISESVDLQITMYPNIVRTYSICMIDDISDALCYKIRDGILTKLQAIDSNTTAQAQTPKLPPAQVQAQATAPATAELRIASQNYDFFRQDPMLAVTRSPESKNKDKSGLRTSDFFN